MIKVSVFATLTMVLIKKFIVRGKLAAICFQRVSYKKQKRLY